MLRKKNKQDWLFHKLPSDQKEYLPTGAAVIDDLPSNLYMHMWPHVHLKHIKQWNKSKIESVLLEFYLQDIKIINVQKGLQRHCIMLAYNQMLVLFSWILSAVQSWRVARILGINKRVFPC